MHFKNAFLNAFFSANSLKSAAGVRARRSQLLGNGVPYNRINLYDQIQRVSSARTRGMTVPTTRERHTPRTGTTDSL